MTTLFTGSQIIQLPSVDSTNNYALQLLKDGNCFEGTVVWALKQTEGRGQRGKSWQATENEALTFSVIYTPVFLAVTCQFRLSMAVSLAVVDYLRNLFESQNADASPLKVKWPNDIYIGDKKVAGILIENAVQQGNLSSSIIGIGLNVNQIDFPSDLPNPTSLKIALGNTFELKEVLGSLCKNIEARYLQLKSSQWQKLENDYQSRLYKLNESTQFIYKGDKISATIKGVNSDGILLLETPNGESLQCNMNDVSMVI